MKLNIKDKLVIFVTVVFIFLCVKANIHIEIRENKITVSQYKILNKFTYDNTKETHVSFKVLNEGYDIYVPSSSTGYHYGPSIIYYDDGTMDAWFAREGNLSTEWDYIAYKHFDGESWSEDKIVLKPTKGSDDHYSTCDPGVIYFNGYYYIGYTSTLNSAGIENELYVARSQNPDGPYEKWNGNGWGGDPKAFINYTEADNGWGVGEIFFIVKDETLYMYYTYTGFNEGYTKVAISDLSENWPANIQFMGRAQNSSMNLCDGFYLEDYDKFICFSMSRTFTDTSGIAIFESDDGLFYTYSDESNNMICQYAHNMGVSKRANGHVKEGDKLIIGYAYGPHWGRWATKFQDIELIVYEGKLKSFN